MSQIGLATTLFVCAVLAAIGSALDRYFLSERFVDWRASVRKVWVDLKGPDVLVTVRDVQRVFFELFNLIYGDRFFSWKRIWASIVSTTLALIVITTLLGWQDSFLQAIVKEIASGKYLIAIFPICFNYIPDYVSLAETRLVLRLAKDKGPLGLSLLVLADLILTTLLFLTGLTVLLLFLGLINLPSLSSSSDIFDFISAIWEIFAEAILQNEEGLLVFYLTTFVTSLLWLFFVLSYISVRVLQKVTKAAFVIIDRILAIKRPASAMSFVVIMLFLGYVIVWDAALHLIQNVGQVN